MWKRRGSPVFEASMQGVSNRSVDELVKAVGGAAVSKSPVSRMCEETNERVKPCPDSPREGDWLYNWPDATDVKVRCNHRIVSVAAIVAVGATISAET
jgi:putative transposase